MQNKQLGMDASEKNGARACLDYIRECMRSKAKPLDGKNALAAVATNALWTRQRLSDAGGAGLKAAPCTAASGGALMTSVLRLGKTQSSTVPWPNMGTGALNGLGYPKARSRKSSLRL